MRTYSGARYPDGTTSVSVDGKPLDPRLNSRTQPATTFDWGYAGLGGPAQLALAILADHLADDEGARRRYEEFLRQVIRTLPRQGWKLTSREIDAALPAGRAVLV